MALLPHSFFPRSAFDMNQWVNPLMKNHSTLDLFDAFDEIDHGMSQNLQWLNKPEFPLNLNPVSMGPHVPQKYRIAVDCPGFTPEAISTTIKDNMLHLKGHMEVGEGKEMKVTEFQKVYELPAHCEVNKLVSFMTKPGHLVLEFPLRETGHHLNMDLFPKIVEYADGSKQMCLDFQVPDNIHPEKVHIHVKDRDMIVKAQDKLDKEDSMTKFYYYKRTTLPENTDFHRLQCSWHNHRIHVQAPLDLNWKPNMHKPIEATHKSGAPRSIKH